MFKVQSKKVGIFGGSFNPIHTGHIALAKSLCEKAGLDEVWFMVSPMNPFKKTATDLLDDHLRLEMVEKALEKEPQLKACDYEFRLPKPSYTWHTLQAISQEFTDIEFTLLIGGLPSTSGIITKISLPTTPSLSIPVREAAWAKCLKA